MAVPSGSQPKPGPLARAISAEVRAIMAERRITAQALAESAGLKRSYLGKRLRDEASLSANDIEAICKALNVDILVFAHNAVSRIPR